MRQLRQMLRLAGDGTSAREIAQRLGIARSTVQDNLKRATAAGLIWPLPGDLTDDALENRLFARAGVKQGLRRLPEPNWADLALELKKPGVTLMLLWEEYRAVHSGGYGYSRFCDLFRSFEKRLSPTMRQEHVAGDKVFVDYSGKKIAIVDPLTGEIREAEIFVGVLGASGYTYAEATWTQTLPDWIGAHVRMFSFFGGVPRLIVPDNLKSGVNHASFYDPEIYRLLKAHDLITSPAFIVIKAADEFHDKTTAPNQLWQSDFTYLKVIGWGWFYLSTVLDDFSRYIIAWKLCTTMKAGDVTDTLELALTASGCDSARVLHKPKLLSDNGPSYIATELAEWIDANGMSHVRGAPLHPQTQGKIERWHQTLKNRILLENYFVPGDLERQVAGFVDHYNYRRYHESIGNLTPADVYFARGQTILLQRERIKRKTIEQRRLQHRKAAA